MWVDLIGLAILVAFVLLGLVRGTLAGILRLTTLLLSYAAGYAGSQLLATEAAVALGLSDLVGSLVAGSGSFLTAFIILSVISSLLLSAERRRVEEEGGRSGRDRIGGALIGAVQGGAIVLLIGWLAIWLDAARSMGVGPLAAEPAAASGAEPAETPEAGPTSNSVVAELTRDVIETAAEATLGDSPEAQLAAGLAARPAETIDHLQNVLESPQIESLQNDDLFWQYLSTGAVDQALNRNSFQSLSYDSNLRGQLADLGLVPDEARDDPQVFRESSREMLQEIGPRLQAMQNDPELQRLAADPEVQRALSSGDTMSLLMNPRFRSLVNRVTSGIQPEN